VGGGGGESVVWLSNDYWVVVVKRLGDCFPKKTGPLPAAAVFTSDPLTGCPFPSAIEKCFRFG